MYRYIKYLGLLLVMLLGLYPIAELTRVIVVSGTYYFPDMDAQFIAEIVLMWILYLSIVPVFLFINNYYVHHQKETGKTPESIGNAKNNEFSSGNRGDYIRVDYNSR